MMQKSPTIKIIAAFTMGISGCSAQQKLVPLAQLNESSVNYVTVDAQFCMPSPTPANQKVKYLFILDHSQVNQNIIAQYPGQPDLADPTGSRRYSAISWLIKNMVQTTNINTSFALIDFNDTANQITDSTYPSGQFDSDSNDFLQNILLPDWIGQGTANQPAPVDGGFTNYNAALAAAYNLISADAASEASNPENTASNVLLSYTLVFVSAGLPIIASPGSPNGVIQQDYNTFIKPVISQIIDLRSNPAIGNMLSSVSLNTAYYYNYSQPSDYSAAAQAELAQMASDGNGQAMFSSSGVDLNYQVFAPPVSLIRNQLVDVFVDSLNMDWDSNGSGQADTAGGGVWDSMKQSFGDKQALNLIDSDGNGVSDLVEYRTKGQMCDGAGCSTQGSDSYSVCDGFNAMVSASGIKTYAVNPGKVFNQCENFVLGADQNAFSSAGNLVPDFTAVRAGLSYLPPAADVFADPYGDNLTNYMKLKLGLPLGVSMQKVPQIIQRVTTLVPTSSPNPSVDCYHLTTSNVGIMSGQINSVRVSVVYNQVFGTNLPGLIQAVRSQGSPVDGTITFSQGDFAP